MNVYLPPLHPNQRMIADHPARFRVLACGRRWGKSRLGALECIRSGLHRQRAWWVSPNYPMSAIGWREIKSLAWQIPLATIREGDRSVTFPGSGYVQIKSADNPNSLRGEGLDFLVMDECAFIDGDAWTQALRPALADRHGRAMFISTPKGRNWFWELFSRADTDWQSWTFPTIDNPYIDPAEVEAAKSMLPELIFRQEFLAEFVDFDGAVFRRVLDCATSTETAYQEGHQYIAGVDIAASVDYTVVSVMDADERRQVHLDRFNRIDYPMLIARLQAIHERYHLSAMVVETNSIGQTVVDFLHAAGLPIIPFTTTLATKSEIIRELSTAFEYGEIAIIREQVQINELLSYQAVKSKSGLYSYSAPAGMHDDTVMALAMAWHGVAGGQPVVLFEV